MNSLIVGAAEKTEPILSLLEDSASNFLLVDDGPLIDAVKAPTRRKVVHFDVSKHSFDIFRGMDHLRARAFAEVIYTASPQGEDTLTQRNGKRAMARYCLKFPSFGKLISWLQQKADDEELTPTQAEVFGTLDDLFLSPFLERVLKKPTNFAFDAIILARLDRKKIGDFDAFVLGHLLISLFKGQVVVPDFGFYGREYLASLIREDRLIAGVRSLNELPPRLRQEALLIENKQGYRTTADDAATLAGYGGFIPGQQGHTEFVKDMVGTERGIEA